MSLISELAKDRVHSIHTPPPAFTQTHHVNVAPVFRENYASSVPSLAVVLGDGVSNVVVLCCGRWLRDSNQVCDRRGRGRSPVVGGRGRWS
jgi:hypothetical protein